MKDSRSRWPMWVFWATVLGALASFGVTVTYYLYTTRMQEQTEQLEKQRAAYQAEIDELRDWIRTLMAPIVSVLVVASSLYVILSAKYKAESEKWAFGTIGTILGFWLKGI